MDPTHTPTTGPPTPWSLLTMRERWDLAVAHALVDPHTPCDKRTHSLERAMSRLFEVEVFNVRPWGPYVPFRPVEENLRPAPDVVAWARESTRRWREGA